MWNAAWWFGEVADLDCGRASRFGPVAAKTPLHGLASMTDEHKQAVGNFLSEQVKSLGFPIVVAGVLFFLQYRETEFNRLRAEKQETRADQQSTLISDVLTTQLGKSTVAIESIAPAVGALAEVVDGFREDQKETRMLMKEMLEHTEAKPK